jgi:hypothetical protein
MKRMCPGVSLCVRDTRGYVCVRPYVVGRDTYPSHRRAIRQRQTHTSSSNRLVRTLVARRRGRPAERHPSAGRGLRDGGATLQEVAWPGGVEFETRKNCETIAVPNQEGASHAVA